MQWLKEQSAEDIGVYEGKDDNSEWDYYRHVSAFVGETLYMVYFTMWENVVEIDYSDGENRYDSISIEEFYNLLW